jgi:2-polyprenyl-3-methyl-5-hydroxy-6-metoxy-1,4-benzoquinol methylase
LVANLPEPELRFLRSGHLSILDWGCAFGEGVDVLSQAFPGNETIGLDFSRTAIDEAIRSYPRHRFLHAPEGVISEWYDVITNSNCLEHFEFPLSVLKSQLLSVRNLFIGLVPYNECPLLEQHRSQFREESFPGRVGDFVRLHSAPIDVEERFWPGRQLLVIYGSEAYARSRLAASVSLAGLSLDRNEAAFSKKESGEIADDPDGADDPDRADDQALDSFSTEFATAVSELLPHGGRTLEAGCGARSRTFALALTGKFQTALLDSSRKALSTASQALGREAVQPQFIEGDLLEPGPPEFDLVFNSGVFERYSDEQQTALLRAMKSRTRRYVLVLAPNRRCYWYWLWRFHRSVRGGGKWEREAPAANLSRFFDAAGLKFLGYRYFGAASTEALISAFFPEGHLQQEILTIHRSKVIPDDQKGYFVGALGAVDPDEPLVRGWEPSAPLASESSAFLAAALADALAFRSAWVAGSGDALARLTAANSELVENNAALIERHRDAVERGRIEVGKRDEIVAYYQRHEAELIEAVRQAGEAAKADLEKMETTNAELSRALSRLTAANAELAALNRDTVERGRLEAEKRDQSAALAKSRESESIEQIAALEKTNSELAAAVARLTRTNTDLIEHHHKAIENATEQLLMRDEALDDRAKGESSALEAQRQLAAAAAAGLAAHKNMLDRLSAEIAKRDETLRHYQEQEAALSETQKQLASANTALVEQHRAAVEHGRAEAAKRDEIIEYYRGHEQELMARLENGPSPAGAGSGGWLSVIRRRFGAGSGRSQ